MRLLADENVPGDLVRALRMAAHDVTWVREVAPGIDDVAVLARAQRETRVLLTFDKDFGELAFRSGLSAECGVVLVRAPGLAPKVLIARVVAAFGALTTTAGSFVVVEKDSLRVTALPGGQAH